MFVKYNEDIAIAKKIEMLVWVGFIKLVLPSDLWVFIYS
jgi:hypothetical protein